MNFGVKPRISVKLKKPNPLFEQWLTEWRDEAIEKDSKMQYCFTKALESLRKYPLPLETGRDCKILQGFGDKLCQMLDNKLLLHNSSSPVIKKVSSPAKSPRIYVPAHRSGAWAILIALYRQTLKTTYVGYTLKMDLTKLAQEFCDKSFDKPDPGSFYTAWSSMKTLLDKQLVTKKGCPAKFSLTAAGNVLAKKLYDNEMGEIVTVIDTRAKNYNIFQSTVSSSNLVNKIEPKKNSSQEESFILAPNTFDVILIVDTSETIGSENSNEDKLLCGLNRKRVHHEVRRLSAGDFVWICREKSTGYELVLPYAVERKRMDDLGSSIKDGRYYEQKFRLQRCGLTNLIYLIESFGKNKHLGLPVESLYQAATNTLIQDGFDVTFTENEFETVEYLVNMSNILEKNYKIKTLASCPKENLNHFNIKDDLISLLTFEEFNKEATKMRKFTVGDLFIRQLLQLKGLSIDKALAISDKYPTSLLLFQFYQKMDEKTGEKLLADIEYGKLKKKVGIAISRTIYQFYTKNNF